MKIQRTNKFFILCNYGSFKNELSALKTLKNMYYTKLINMKFILTNSLEYKSIIFNGKAFCID